MQTGCRIPPGIGEREPMNRRLQQRSAFLMGLLCLLLVGACALWVQSQQRQYALNRRLMAALWKFDDPQALALVNAGADPNTPYALPQAPSLRHLWKDLFHHSVQPGEANTNALLLACGGHWDTGHGSIEARPARRMPPNWCSPCSGMARIRTHRTQTAGLP
jgi:hypothetical protein